MPENMAYIEERIESFRRDINIYHASLKKESVWLFLATVGCLGIPNKTIQLIAFLITVILFVTRIKNELNDTRPFKNIIDSIKNDIHEKLPEDNDYKKDRLYDLKQIEDSLNVSFFLFFIKFPIFAICWSFYALSFVHILS